MTDPRVSLLSAAEITFCAINFTGIIGVVLWAEKYRIATYLGAKALQIRSGELLITQAKFRLTAKLIRSMTTRFLLPFAEEWNDLSVKVCHVPPITLLKNR
jgi:hypothetical protein